MMRNECQKCGYCSTPARNCAGCGGTGTMLHVDETKDQLRAKVARFEEALREIAFHGTSRPAEMGGGDDGDHWYRRIAYGMIGTAARALHENAVNGGTHDGRIATMRNTLLDTGKELRRMRLAFDVGDSRREEVLRLADACETIANVSEDT